jgi:hypothetical protein
LCVTQVKRPAACAYEKDGHAQNRSRYRMPAPDNRLA